MSYESTKTEGFTLWYRRGPSHDWSEVATGGTEAELTARLVKLPTGEAITLPAGKHPDRRRKVR